MSTKKKYNSNSLRKKFGEMTAGLFIKAFREADEITQTTFAKKIGISKSNLCDIEKGRKILSPKRAIKIAQKIGVDEAILLQLCLQDALSALDVPFKVNIKKAA